MSDEKKKKKTSTKMTCTIRVCVQKNITKSFVNLKRKWNQTRDKQFENYSEKKVSVIDCEIFFYQNVKKEKNVNT